MEARCADLNQVGRSMQAIASACSTGGFDPHRNVAFNVSDARNARSASALLPPNAMATHVADLPQDPTGPATTAQPDGDIAPLQSGAPTAGGSNVYCAVAVEELSVSVQADVASLVSSVTFR